MASISPDIIRNPFIGTNGNWYVWDSSAYNFVDSGISATSGDSIRYASQTLTDEQKAQAISNIGAATAAQGALADTAVQPAALLNLIYPVGAIYQSVVSTSPATLFGGTWAALGAGCVLVGIDAGQAIFDTAEKTGGENAHALSVDELATHIHTYPFDSSPAGALYGNSGTLIGNKAGDIATSSAGSGTAHNNLQPYIVVYRWKRTA